MFAHVNALKIQEKSQKLIQASKNEIQYHS